MQASESKGTLDSVCWEAAHVHLIRCRTAWEGVVFCFVFFFSGFQGEFRLVRCKNVYG